MKRTLLGMVAFTISLMARNAEGVPLFAEVVSLKENETLGIHENAGYESEKRGELHLGERVMVDICVNSLSLKWCRVKSEDEADGAREGWVNSRYLDFHNNGYVRVLGDEGRCFYSVGCIWKDGRQLCKIVYDTGKKGERPYYLKTRWIERSRIEPQTEVGAGRGEKRCEREEYILEYIRRNPFSMCRTDI